MIKFYINERVVKDAEKRKRERERERESER